MAIKTVNNSETTSYTLKSHGFTLIEMAIVLVIMGLILGGLLMPLGAKMENERRASTSKSLEDIKKAIFGYTVIYKRLPCPDTNGDGIAEGSCLNTEGRPYRYRVDNAFSVTIADPPDTESGLQVRDRASSALIAGDPNAAVAIIFSCGSNGRPDDDNDANNAANADANCTNPGSPNKFYTQDISTKDQFDDQLIWISRNTLINQLITSGKWP